MENDLVSIIIPAYNSSKYIEETLESCFNQTYRNIEIIVVNDGSVDDTAEKVLKFKSRGKLELINQKNKGLEAAKNAGLVISSGKYIQFLDSDDLISSNKISEQVKLLKKNPKKIAVCRTIKFETNIIIDKKFEIDTKFLFNSNNGIDFILNLNRNDGMIQPNAFLVEKEMIDNFGVFDEGLNPSPDESEFFFRLIINSEGIIYSENTFNFYRSVPHEISLSKKKTPIAADAALRTIEKKQQLLMKIRSEWKFKQAIAFQYSLFMYKYYDLYPEIARRAEQNISSLGLKRIPVSGGKYFKILSQIIGMKNSLFIRKAFRL